MIRPYVPWPALLIRNRKKTLVISDLHLGFEFELAGRGINLPSQTSKLKENLVQLLERVNPDCLVVLGDLKHSIPKISLQEWRDIPLFFEDVGSRVPEIQVLLGNHDGRISLFSTPNIRVVSSRGMLMGEKEKVGLFHGHAWPSPKLFEADYWVIGHNHPAVQFKGPLGFRTLKPIWVKAPVNRKKLVESFLKYRNMKIGVENPEKILKRMFGVEARCSRLVVMPAFNDLLGGLPFNVKNKEELLGPVLRSDGVVLSQAEVFLTDGTFLGVLKNLRKLG